MVWLSPDHDDYMHLPIDPMNDFLLVLEIREEHNSYVVVATHLGVGHIHKADIRAGVEVLDARRPISRDDRRESK